MVKTVFASIIAVAATIFLSIGAAAGATVQHFNLNTPEQCFYKLDYKYCVVSAGEETAVQTASGNFSAAVNASDSWVFSQNATILASGTDLPRLARDTRAYGEQALALLEQGLGGYGAAP